MKKIALIRSREEGESPWISTSGCSAVVVEGLEDGDLVRLSLSPSMERLEVNQNGRHEVLDGAGRVKVYHPCQSPDSCVTVMLES